MVYKHADSLKIGKRREKGKKKVGSMCGQSVGMSQA